MKKAKSAVKKLTAKQSSAIKAYAAKGKSQRWIAAKVGCSRSAVFYHIHR